MSSGFPLGLPPTPKLTPLQRLPTVDPVGIAINQCPNLLEVRFWTMSALRDHHRYTTLVDGVAQWWICA